MKLMLTEKNILTKLIHCRENLQNFINISFSINSDLIQLFLSELHLHYTELLIY